MALAPWADRRDDHPAQSTQEPLRLMRQHWSLPPPEARLRQCLFVGRCVEDRNAVVITRGRRQAPPLRTNLDRLNADDVETSISEFWVLDADRHRGDLGHDWHCHEIPLPGE